MITNDVLFTKNACTITAQVEGKMISRDQLNHWLKTRIRYVEKQLGFAPLPDGEAERMLRDLTKEKLALTREQIVHKIGNNLDQSHAMMVKAAKDSQGKTQNSLAVLTVEGLDLDTFLDAFKHLQTENSPKNLEINIGVCPDHYYLGKSPDGRTEVIETCGNMPVQSDIYVAYGDMKGMNSKRDKDFEYELAGAGRTVDGVFEGAVRHQLKRTHNGFIGKFLVEYPAALKTEYVKAHQMHLVCEFSHWILATINYTDKTE